MNGSSFYSEILLHGLRQFLPDCILQSRTVCGSFLHYGKLRFHNICPAERTFYVLGDGQIENGRRVTAKPFTCFTGNCVSVKQKKIICPAERPLRVLGDGRIENGRRVTAKPFSCFTK